MEPMWRKSWAEKNLNPEGTKRAMSPVHRSIWDDLLDLASISPVTGQVVVAPGVLYTLDQLSAIFRVEKRDITEALSRFAQLGLIDKDYRILTWSDHQSEYQRLKKYRKTTDHCTDKGTTKGTRTDSDLDSDSKRTTLSGAARRLAARKALQFLNEKANRKFPETDANLGLIEARLREGFTEEQLRQVVAKKVREWGAEEKMVEYLRPSTLFGRIKFSQYVGQLVAPAKEDAKR